MPAATFPWLAYMLVGAGLSLYMHFYRKRHPGNEPRVLTPDDIGKETTELA